MRLRVFFPTWIILAILLLFFSQTFATKSRLLGMGNLSIVIEDESNMINLWDFCGNPAALLEDEEGSVLRGDFKWHTFEVDSLPYYDPHTHSLLHKFEINGDIYDNRGSFVFRRDNNFALGLGGNYFFRRTDSEWDRQEIEYPNAILVFSKSITPLTSLGAGLRYEYYDFLFRRVEDYWEGGLLEQNQETLKDFHIEMGVRRKLSPEATFGAVLGYEHLQVDWDYQEYWYHSGSPDSYFFPVGENVSNIGWMSWQAVVEMKHKVKMGIEGIWWFQNKEDYKKTEGRFRFKLRGVYDPFPALRLGVFFSDGVSFAEERDPVYSYFSSVRDDIFTRKLGGGCALRFVKPLLVGIEYHYTDFPQPWYKAYPSGLKTHSVNLGVEGELSEALFLRGGYINTTFIPKTEDLKDSWENTFTFGLGFEPLESDLILELSYCYALKKYRDWYGELDLESGTRVFSFSFKKML